MYKDARENKVDENDKQGIERRKKERDKTYSQRKEEK